jgi:hypothetical protein
VQIYLFRDQSGSNKFAYSTDVTGRNIPRPAARAEWSFVSVKVPHEIPLDPDLVQHLQRYGFYLFEKVS